MRSLQFRIFVLLIACVVLCAITLSIWANIEFRNLGPRQFHHESLQFLADELEDRWNQPDHREFHDLIHRMSIDLRSRFQWLDANGQDLLGNDNRPEFRILNQQAKWKPRRPGDFLAFDQIRTMPPQRGERGMIGFVNSTRSGQHLLVQWVRLPARHIPLFLFISIIGVLTLFGLLISRHVALPVQRLRQTMNDFGNGNLKSRSEIRRSDEIGDLAKTFNFMAERVAADIQRERSMVRNIAHEVRSPLTRMNLLLERVRNQKETAISLDRLESEIQTLGRIPDLLILMADIEQGRAKINIQDIEIQTFLDFYLQRLEPVATSKNCRLELIQPEFHENETFQTDPEILGRCVENIIENAIRFTPPDSRIEIGCELSHDEIRLSFRDYGPGVPEDELERIFQAFFRSDASRNRHTGGLGLGLSITASAVKALGGTVTAMNAKPGLLIEIRMPLKFSIHDKGM